MLSASGGPVVPGPRRSYCEFRQDPAHSGRLGTAATGTAGDRNQMVFGGYGSVPACEFNTHVKGTQTILAPVITAVGLDIGSQDQTADDGIELTQGITARSPMAFVIGQHAFYLRVELTLDDVSGTDDCAFGFRGAEAHQANIDDYNDFAVANVISGTIKQETALNNAATTTTSMGVAWADAEKKTLLVKVDKTGLATFFYSTTAAFDAYGNPQAQTFTEITGVSFTFDSGDSVVPFAFFLQDTDITKCELSCWDCGIQ